jgi:hypothetical protein
MIVRSPELRNPKENRRARRQKPSYFPGRYDITVEVLLRRVEGAKI